MNFEKDGSMQQMEGSCKSQNNENHLEKFNSFAIWIRWLFKEPKVPNSTSWNLNFSSGWLDCWDLFMSTTEINRYTMQQCVSIYITFGHVYQKYRQLQAQIHDWILDSIPRYLLYILRTLEYQKRSRERRQMKCWHCPTQWHLLMHFIKEMNGDEVFFMSHFWA